MGGKESKFRKQYTPVQFYLKIHAEYSGISNFKFLVIFPVAFYHVKPKPMSKLIFFLSNTVCLFVNAVGWYPTPQSFPASLSSIGNYARWGCRDPLSGPAGTLWAAALLACTRQGDLTYSNLRSGVLLG